MHIVAEVWKDELPHIYIVYMYQMKSTSHFEVFPSTSLNRARAMRVLKMGENNVIEEQTSQVHSAVCLWQAERA